VAHVDDLVLPRGTARVVSVGGRWLAMTASENGPPWYIGHANDVSLAVAARDAAIERADQQMAARFAGEARDAIATAVKAGVTLDELAEEIGYPDGAEAMDGPHIDRQIADMHDNGPAFALGSLPESQEGWPRWLEVTETESLLVNGFMPLVDLSEPAACCVRRPSAAGAAPHCAGGPTAGS
jgi:hypothetical protein